MNGQSQRQFTGWHMLGVMVAFFGTVIAVNLTMAVFAATSWTGLITKDSYLAGQAHNAELENARRQAALGLSGTLAIDPSAVEFRFVDRAGQPVIADDVAVKLGRPATDADDRVIALDYVGAGLYRSATTLAPGQWQADLTATLTDGVRWRRIWRLHLSEDADR